MNDDMLLSARLDRLEVAIGEIRGSNLRMANALERLVAIEVQHAETRTAVDRAFIDIAENNIRIQAIERRVAVWDDVVICNDEVVGRLAKLETSVPKWDAAYAAIVWFIAITVLAAVTMVWVKSGGVT